VIFDGRCGIAFQLWLYRLLPSPAWTHSFSLGTILERGPLDHGRLHVDGEEVAPIDVSLDANCHLTLSLGTQFRVGLENAAEVKGCAARNILPYLRGALGTDDRVGRNDGKHGFHGHLETV
jgi:hypothetical protein